MTMRNQPYSCLQCSVDGNGCKPSSKTAWCMSDPKFAKRSSNRVLLVHRLNRVASKSGRFLGNLGASINKTQTYTSRSADSTYISSSESSTIKMARCTPGSSMMPAEEISSTELKLMGLVADYLWAYWRLPMSAGINYFDRK